MRLVVVTVTKLGGDTPAYVNFAGLEPVPHFNDDSIMTNGKVIVLLTPTLKQ